MVVVNYLGSSWLNSGNHLSGWHLTPRVCNKREIILHHDVDITSLLLGIIQPTNTSRSLLLGMWTSSRLPMAVYTELDEKITYPCSLGKFYLSLYFQSKTNISTSSHTKYCGSVAEFISYRNHEYLSQLLHFTSQQAKNFDNRLNNHYSIRQNILYLFITPS